MAEKDQAYRYNSAIKILAKNEEWIIFKEFIANKIRILTMANNIPVATEDDKAKHNYRVGFISGLNVVLTIADNIEEADKWEATAAAKIKDAEEYNRQRR